MRKMHFECGGNSSVNGQKSAFLMIPNMGLPINRHLLTVRSHEECESSCLSSFSCTTYAYYNGCSLWNSDLINLQQLSSGEGQDLYLRLAATELRVGPKERSNDWGSYRGSGRICIYVDCYYNPSGLKVHKAQQMTSLKVVQGS